MRGAPAPLVVCGDFNVDRDSPVFGRFVVAAGLADAFEGSCPATFRADYLPAGETPRCLDFILTGSGVKAEAAAVVFAGTEPLPGGPGHLSDQSGCGKLVPSAVTGGLAAAEHPVQAVAGSWTGCVSSCRPGAAARLCASPMRVGEQGRGIRRRRASMKVPNAW